MSNPLNAFHPTIRHWFEQQFDAPTNVQRHAWPVIESGSHALITAPTGSGKTLTAFLWALDRFASGMWKPGATRVLYISPLKALNNDIQRNLLTPLTELRQQQGFPQVIVQTRSGDTSPNDRQRMLRKPPDILITTPESLSLLLTTTRGRLALATVETLILDEIHSLVENRRGVSLMTSAERLVDLCGNVQRIALSATVSPLEKIATYVGGYDDTGKQRPVKIINPSDTKEISLKVRYPESVKHASENGLSVWDPLAERFREHALKNRSTLFFTNSRAMAEKITLKINQQSPMLLAYAHHGSLAREIRTEVERRLKNQELRAIVATSSLEMGIDIGNLDQVVLMQSPPGIAATLQRIGRAGHKVGEESRGVLYPIHAADFIEAAALASAVQQRDLEPLRPMTGALDILSQVIVSMCASETWTADALYELLRRSAPYARLPREQFDLVIDLLSGRYAGARVRELQSRIVYNRLQGTIDTKKSALFALYNSGGSIPDRGYYQIRHADSGAKIGELDEEFVWEARTGDTFSLGTQNWQVKQITHNDVFVNTAPAGVAPPFWRAERYNRSFHYATRIGEFLHDADTLLDDKATAKLQANLQQHLDFDELASKKITDYLQRQRDASSAPLPHRRHLLLELVNSGPGGYRGSEDQRQLVVHTMWGGRLNHPWSLALQSAWKERFAESPETHADNDAIVIQTTLDPDPAEVLALITPANLDFHLRASLESSGFFGTRFRECAGRFLLLPRRRFNQRLPLWMSRLQAKKLMSATMHLETFPVMLEAWRTCLNDEFEIPELVKMLNEVADGVCEWSFVRTSTPTPFAANLNFDQINRYMYADDTPEASSVSALSEDLIKAAVQNENLRPQISIDTANNFSSKRRRTHPDYAPRDCDEWTEWVKERVLLPHNEWWKEWQDNPATANRFLCELRLNSKRWVCHLEDAAHLIDSGLAAGVEWHAGKTKSLPVVPNARSHSALVGEILSYYGPLAEQEIAELIPVIPSDYFTSETYVKGTLLEGISDTLYCDTNNFETLLRWQRAANRPVFQALPSHRLSPVLANWHRFNSDSCEQSIVEAMEKLRGYRTTIPALLTDIFAARLNGFADHQLDSTFTSQEFSWLGFEKKQVTLCYPEDIPLLLDITPDKEAESVLPEQIVKDRTARYSYAQIAEQLKSIDPSCTPESIDTLWWSAIWSGQVNSDSLSSLRQGLLKNFRSGATGRSTSRAISGARRRARLSSKVWPGNWQMITPQIGDHDPLTELEDCRERVHWLLDRYGVICREIANREGGTLRWSALFRALRVMELSGEVLQGLFFDDLSGPQFISHHAYNRLLQNENPPAHYWCNAVDPVSPCGLGLDWPELPQRRAQNYLAFYKGELNLVAENFGKRIHIYMDAEDNNIDQLLAPLVHIAVTKGKVLIEEINRQSCRQSPYLAALSRVLNKRGDHRNLYFEP